jgi:DNA modification methylase
MYKIHCGDCLEVMQGMDENSVDTIITDPPYGLAFMGKHWDYGLPGKVYWEVALRVAKPGAMLLAFGGTRTYHRLTCAIEDAGWEIRDCVMWVYGSGFPKSHDISKGIDKRGGNAVGWFGPWFREWREKNDITQKEVAALFPSRSGGLTGCVANWELGFNMPTPEQFNTICKTFDLPFESIEEAEREVVGENTKGSSPLPGNHNGTWTDEQRDGTFNITTPSTPAARLWHGYGTALKPAHEPIVLAMKPLDGTFAENALKWGVGGLWIDGARVGLTQYDHEEYIPNRIGYKDGIDYKQKAHQRGGNVYGGGKGYDKEFVDSHQTIKPQGRFPANLIHDGSPEVVKGFPNSKSPKPYKRSTKRTTSLYGIDDGNGGQYADTGSAARFFYTAKASRAERNVGMGNSITLELEVCPCGENTERVISLVRAISELVTGMENQGCNMTLSGKTTTGLSCQDIVFTTSTEINKTTELKILNVSILLPTSEYIQDVIKTIQECGLSLVASVESISQSLNIMNEKAESARGVKVVVSETPLKISASAKPFNNFHPTVKSLALMRYLVKLTRTPTGGTVLDPFMGSGTTGMACMKEGRKFIGIEKEEEYCRIAKKRIAASIDAQLQLE